MSLVATVRIPLMNRERHIVPSARITCEPPVMLDARMLWLPEPSRIHAEWLNESLLVALSDRDGRWVATCLEMGITHLTKQELIGALWLPLVIGAAQLARQDKPLHNADLALGVLRSQARTMIDSRPADRATVWVVPADDHALDRTAAHITAACLCQHGTDARPWLWSMCPAIGRCLRSGFDPRPHDDYITVSIMPGSGLHHIAKLLLPDWK